MRISLMPYIPNQFVRREMEDTVQRQGQLDGAQTGCEMPAVHGYRMDDKGPDLLCQLLQLLLAQPPDALRLFYALK